MTDDWVIEEAQRQTGPALSKLLDGFDRQWVVTALAESCLRAGREHQAQWDQSYMKSCPWCFAPMQDLTTQGQFMHLIGCGDKTQADREQRGYQRGLREAEEIAARLYNTHGDEIACEIRALTRTEGGA